MRTTISKIGDSQGVIFDTDLMDPAGIKLGDEFTVTLNEGGAIILTPVRSKLDPANAATMAARLIRTNLDLFKRLS